MANWWDLLLGGQAPAFPQGQSPSPDFVPQRMAIAPTFAQAPQMAQDVAAGIADPLLKAGNYLGGIMQGSQQFSWPETIQHGAALAMALAPGPGRAREAAGALERGAAGVAKGAAEIAPTGIRAFHGSPYDFPAFDISKIGTGEGAQAYGHGLYFAENEAVAKAYRDALAGLPTRTDKSPVGDLVAQSLQKSNNDIPQAIERLRGRTQETPFKDEALNATHQETINAAIKHLESINPGKMYEVNIKAQPEQFLDYEKPIHQQSPAVTEAINKAYPGLIEQRTAPDKSPTIASAFPYGLNASVVEKLREAGIPGIRYLDQGSRGSGQGTHNYVVFNDKLIEIMRKYGLIGALGGSMSAPYFAPQGQQQ